MKPLRIVALLSLLVLLSFTNPPKDTRFQYTFKVGDRYQLTQVVKQTMKQSIPAMGDATVEISSESVLALNITSVTATGAKIDTHFEKMKIWTKLPMGMGDMTLDSEGDAEDSQTKVVKSIMNKTFYFTITKQGVIEKVEGTENLFTDLEKLDLDDATLNAFKAQFKQSLNDQSMKARLEQALVSYADKKVKIGDTWSTTTANEVMGMPTRIAQTWSLKSAEAAKASIRAEGSVASTDKDKVMDLPNGIRGKLNVGGKQTLAAVVNPKTGWPVETKVNAEVKGIMTFLAGGMMPSDMEVPIETVAEGVHKIVKR
jgi:hypothetical protein